MGAADPGGLDKGQATHTNGVLALRLPKHEVAKPNRLVITGESGPGGHGAVRSRYAVAEDRRTAAPPSSLRGWVSGPQSR
jgi:hypothetical protein